MTSQMITFYGPDGVELGKTPLRPTDYDPETGEFSERIYHLKPKGSTSYRITDQISLELNLRDPRTGSATQIAVD